MFEEIKRRIDEAAVDDRKVAMLHFQILKNASGLETTDPDEFCRLVGIRPSYATEFRKMLNLARLMQEEGIRLG